MDKEQLNPLQMVARELSENIDMESDLIEGSIKDLLMYLQARAISAIDQDENSEEALKTTIQYRVICELIALFGTQLIAFEDMEDELPRAPSN